MTLDPSDTQGTTLAPARQVLLDGEHAAKAQGHPDEGFLTEAYGFLPVGKPPLLALPPSHRTWDDVAALLPELVRTRRVRQALRDLPALSVAEGDLADGDLCRAAMTLGMLVHAYARGDGTEDRQIPERLLTPWREVARRLGRPGPALTFNDIIGYNWRLRDPLARQPLTVANVDMLIPTTGSETERVFQMTFLEMTAEAAPIVGAVVRAQEAVLSSDATALHRELAVITECLRRLTFVSFLKIDPNPHSETHVDQVVWAKTVASFAASVVDGEPGMSGAATPFLHVLDAFFGRTVFASTIGHEAAAFIAWQPLRYQRFLEAIRAVPVGDFVARSKDTRLKGAWQACLDAFAGERGFLGVHRLKLYGFMELGFKSGRAVTNGGFAGGRETRFWDRIDDAMETARLERYLGLPVTAHVAWRVLTASTTDDEQDTVRRIRLAVTDQGLRYEAGDRLAVLARNAPELIAKTLRALRAKGDEPVGLTKAWKEALVPVMGTEVPDSLPLATFLAHAAIRPLPRSVAKALFTLTRHPVLKSLLAHRHEDQWELWDVLETVGAGSYEVQRLWRAEPWESESLARIVPPLRPRLYSISSAPIPDAGGDAQHVDLTIGGLRIATAPDQAETPRQQRGVASNFLTQPQSDVWLDMPVQVIRPSRFHLPDDPTRPIAMFAGGTGISPFRSFLQARRQQPDSGTNHLYFGTRTPASFYYRKELEAEVAAGTVALHVAFSRTPVRGRCREGALVLDPGPSGYVDCLLADEAEARALWHVMRSRSDGGEGGYLYICGQTSFAATVIGALKDVIRRFSPGGTEPSAIDRTFYRLVAEGRLMMDIFTTAAPVTAAGVRGYRPFETSEIVLHNDEACGFWLVIQGHVYDVTEFLHMHPGGLRILAATAGMDATRSYEKVSHHLNPEVHAMLDLYKIGAVRRLDFGSAWGVALSQTGDAVVSAGAAVGRTHVTYVSLHDLFRAWVTFAYAIVEAENALANNLAIRFQALTKGEQPDDLTPMKAQLLIDVHAAFVGAVLPGLLGASLDELWAKTIGLCAPTEDVGRLRRAIDRIMGSGDAGFVQRCGDLTLESMAPLGYPADDGNGQAWSRVTAELDMMAGHALRVLAKMKRRVRQGLQVFEMHEAATQAKGGAELASILPRVVDCLEDYVTDLAAAFH